MTQDNKPTLLAMPCPFAGSGTIAAIGNNTGDSVNFRDGFPSIYGAPTSNNGKFVTRGEMNAIGNLASKNDFYSRCGGINTFNSELANLIGGYPKGAVLEKLDGSNLNKVISLVDDNNIDFNSVGVDGVNWMYLNIPDSIVAKNIIFNASINGSRGTSILASYYSEVNNFFHIENEIQTNMAGTTDLVINPGTSIFLGQGLFVKEFSTKSPTEAERELPSVTFTDHNNYTVKDNGWKLLAGNLKLLLVTDSSVIERDYLPIANPQFLQDKYYIFVFANYGSEFVSAISANNQWNVKLQSFSSVTGNIKVSLK